MFKNKWVRYSLVGLLAVLVLLWVAGFVVLKERNPAARNTQPILSAKSDEILKRACFDCHSNETRYPWYANVPPISFGVAMHIAEAREELNFSNWDTLPQGKRAHKLQHAWAEIKEGEMPLGSYIWLHPEAKLSQADKDQISQDIATVYGPQYLLPPKHGEQGEGGEHNEAGEHGDDHDGDKD